MPEMVLNQIQYLCKLISKVEWSGALFYTTEGNIEDPENFVITLKTILPLDMGSQAYTEYNLDERFIDFIDADFDERCTWKLGHIHSHNTMAVFFSGTDLAELNDNAPSHNFYLSLIVNNFMDFTAKVAFIGEAKQSIKQVPFTAMNVRGHSYIIEEQDFVVDSKKLFMYDCDIQSPLVSITVDEDFANQVKEIMKPKPVAPRNNYVPTSYTPNAWTKGAYTDPNSSKKFQDYSQNSLYSKNNYNQRSLFDDWDTPSEGYGLIEHEEDIQNLCMDLFNVSNLRLEVNDNLEDIIELLQEVPMTPQEIAKSVITNYAKSFNRYFPKATSEEFVQYSGEVVDLLDEHVIMYPFIKPSITTIENMVIKFMEDGTESTKFKI